MAFDEGDGSESLHWMVVMIRRRLGGRGGQVFTDVLIFSVAAGLIAWAISMVWEVVKPVHDYLNQPDIRLIVVAALAVVLVGVILTVPTMLIIDTAKRLLYARRHVLMRKDIDKVLESGNLSDENRRRLHRVGNGLQMRRIAIRIGNPKP